jgi:hypothetical protein
MRLTFPGSRFVCRKSQRTYGQVDRRQKYLPIDWNPRETKRFRQEKKFTYFGAKSCN